MYEAAVEPLDFARLAVQAIKTDTLYVNSHRATLEFAQERLNWMVADTERLGHNSLSPHRVGVPALFDTRSNTRGSIDCGQCRRRHVKQRSDFEYGARQGVDFQWLACL